MSQCGNNNELALLYHVIVSCKRPIPHLVSAPSTNSRNWNAESIMQLRKTALFTKKRLWRRVRSYDVNKSSKKQLANSSFLKYWKVNNDINLYKSPNNFCGLSLDKTDLVIVIRRYPSSDSISTEERQRNEQALKLNFNRSRKTKKHTFCRSQWRRN